MTQSDPTCEADTAPDLHPVCEGHCGSLLWTRGTFGRITHKHDCPRRFEPFCQTHPTTCPLATTPRTEAGRNLLANEAYNSRSFALITAEAIVAIEDEAAALSSPPPSLIDAALAVIASSDAHEVGLASDDSIAALRAALAQATRAGETFWDEDAHRVDLPAKSSLDALRAVEYEARAWHDAIRRGDFGPGTCACDRMDGTRCSLGAALEGAPHDPE